MQSSTPRATGIFARLRARLRGDRFMADADAATPAAPERRPDPAPVASPDPAPVPSRESRRESG